jgi:xanthine dehydrogenase accessory factor
MTDVPTLGPAPRATAGAAATIGATKATGPHAGPEDALAAALRLRQQGQPFALVSVLRVKAPASARPGDKAVVTADGLVAGWIGGGCAQPAVVRTVRQALQDGQARVIRIAPAVADAASPGSGAGPASRGAAGLSAGGEAGPEAGGETAGPVLQLIDDVLEFGMACHSGGTLELFVDPVLPQARLLVIGDTPLAAALAALAPRVGLPVTLAAHGADAARHADAERVLATDEPAALAAAVGPGAFVVVATQGRRDVQGLRAALAVGARAVFFVASPRKAQILRDSLVAAGEDAAAVRAIVAPAGPDIGAHTPEEIALSVLAGVVAARRRAPASQPALVAPADAAPTAPMTPPGGGGDAAVSALPALPAVGGRSCCGG